MIHISRNVLRLLRIRKAKQKQPAFTERNQSYEIDKMKTICGSKANETWLIDAINIKTKQIIEGLVGRRTKENVKKVVDSVLTLTPKQIF